ncbi:hypothetical protein JW707_00810, partial [Candidatus Woesearchaeota archaeon]|nr:hypothetical protein [Candidatus Woesearchaeota archaeon]
MKKIMFSLFAVLVLCLSAMPVFAEEALYTLTVNEESTTGFYVEGIKYEATVGDATNTSCGIIINGKLAWVNEGAKATVNGLALSIDSAEEVADGPSRCTVTFFGDSIWGDIPIILVVDDKAPASDVVTIVDIATELESDHNLDSTGKLNSEVTKSYLKDKVTMFVYYSKAVVIVDDNAPAIHVMIAQDMAAMIKQMKGIEADVILVSEVPSDDLREIFAPVEEEEEDEETDYDLGAYPKMFASLPDNSRYISVGDKAPASDVVGAVDIATGLKAAGIEVGPAMLDFEVKNYYDNNIAVGNPCNNDVSDKLMGRPEPCTKGLKDGVGQIRLKRFYDNYQVIVTGYSDLDVRKASKVLANFDDYNLDG